MYPGEVMKMHTPYTQKLIKSLELENTYTTDHLAELLHAHPTSMRAKGVITKAGEDLLIIFITLHKRSDATPYQDHLDGTVLHWEGQLKNKYAEQYMKDGTHEVFVFIREQPRTPYTYYGRAVPIRYKILPPGIPSQVELHLYQYEEKLEQRFLGIDESMSHDSESSYAPAHTETNRSILVRTAQGKYRKDALALWGNRCAVTGVAEPKVLIASHIKPWRESKDEERVDARNSLILSPTYDKLFDLGFITFKPNNGKIILSSAISPGNWDKLKIDDSRELKMIPQGTERFLDYHNNHIFGFTAGQRKEEELLIV